MLDELIVYPGNGSPLGLSFQGARANLAVYSGLEGPLVLGVRLDGKIREIALNRSGNVWHAAFDGWSERMEYAFRVYPDTWLSDPMSRFLATSNRWGDGVKSPWCRMKTPKPFDWQNVKKPNLPKSDLVIYEMHIRGFTAHASSGASHPGTYRAMIEKIPYLLDLGVNAVELMPVFEFDETRAFEKDTHSLPNYWGYDPLSFFSPMRRYAATEDAVGEFKTLVRELHRGGIEIILDVVFNHTGEKERTFSLRGLDEKAYYMLDRQGKPLDYSGCKNTVNANHPAATELILASLKYWAEEMQVDGFRFDLASILTRGTDGAVLEKPPLLEKIAALKGVKLIAESWDAAGLYQLGQFPRLGPWSEWNGKFRDRTRRFMKGEVSAAKFADVFSGSEFLYRGYSPSCSVNFVTAHDGFSLNDLVSYNEKHNIANGEKNQDGSNENWSSNFGVEGPSDDPQVVNARERQMRNFLLALFLSQGIPMLLMGDEYGHTRKGNNNPFVQDNEINWFLWDEAKTKQGRIAFVKCLIAFRKKQPELKRSGFLTDADVVWHGKEPGKPDWSDEGRFLACVLKAPHPLYIAFNASPESVRITLPPGAWKEVVRTDKPWRAHHLDSPERGAPLVSPFELPPFAALLSLST